jgi:phage tail tube protein FII
MSEGQPETVVIRFNSTRRPEVGPVSGIVDPAVVKEQIRDIGVGELGLKKEDVKAGGVASPCDIDRGRTTYRLEVSVQAAMNAALRRPDVRIEEGPPVERKPAIQYKTKKKEKGTKP